MPTKVVGRHFALIWMTLAVLFVFSLVLSFLAGSANSLYTNTATTLLGALVGLVGGKAVD